MNVEKARRSLHVLILLFGAVIIGMAGYQAWLLKQREAAKSLGQVQPFELLDQSGRKRTLEDLKGRVWVADFVFTRCLGPCPLLTTKMSELQAEFKDPDLRFVSISADPAYDTPKVLAGYAQNYNVDGNRWFFLTGDKRDVYRLINDSFHLVVEENPHAKNGEEVIHSIYFVLVDREGRIKSYYNTADSGEMADLKKALRRLL